MKGVSIWQFTDNWRGLNVDGNINVLPLQASAGSISQAPKKIKGKDRLLKHKATIYNKHGKHTHHKALKKHASVITYGKKKTILDKKYYRIGKNKYIILTNNYSQKKGTG